jgi:hypothetical protein
MNIASAAEETGVENGSAPGDLSAVIRSLRWYVHFIRAGIPPSVIAALTVGSAGDALDSWERLRGIDDEDFSKLVVSVRRGPQQYYGTMTAAELSEELTSLRGRKSGELRKSTCFF